MSLKDNTYGIADLQEKMLEILKYFIGICAENHLQYWLAYGTCLGALREQGFIPWDDDLDVYMPRPDYERLWTLLKDSQNEKYKLCRTTKEKNYHHRVMQLTDLSTTFIHRRCAEEDLEHGVYIDIIPLDARADNIFSAYRQVLDAVLFSVYNIQCEPEYGAGKIVAFATRLLLSLVKNKDTRYRIWSKAEKRMTKYDWNKAERVLVTTASLKGLMTPYPKAWFGNRSAGFEDIMANIPQHAEEYCAQLYGDYRKLPPVEKRRVRHNTVKIDLENCYTKYKGVYYCKKQGAAND